MITEGDKALQKGLSWEVKDQQPGLPVLTTWGDTSKLWRVLIKWGIKPSYLFKNKELDQFAYSPSIS